MTQKTVHIVGGGLAGSEAAWQCLLLSHFQCHRVQTDYQ